MRHIVEANSFTDYISIDETSMLSANIFEQLNYVCQIVKNNTLTFGDIQVTGIRDFYQLGPVPNLDYGDWGQYCFLSE